MNYRDATLIGIAALTVTGCTATDDTIVCEAAAAHIAQCTGVDSALHATCDADTAEATLDLPCDALNDSKSDFFLDFCSWVGNNVICDFIRDQNCGMEASKENGRFEYCRGQSTIVDNRDDGFKTKGPDWTTGEWQRSIGGDFLVCKQDTCTAEWHFKAEPGWFLLKAFYPVRDRVVREHAPFASRVNYTIHTRHPERIAASKKPGFECDYYGGCTLETDYLDRWIDQSGTTGYGFIGKVSLLTDTVVRMQVPQGSLVAADAIEFLRLVGHGNGPIGVDNEWWFATEPWYPTKDCPCCGIHRHLGCVDPNEN